LIWINLKHPAAGRLYVTCLEKYPVLNIDWLSTWPPPNYYYHPLGTLGAITVNASVATVRKGASTCLKQANDATDGLAKLLFEWITYECGVEGGETSRRLVPPKGNRSGR
jgi:hypothetical protein